MRACRSFVAAALLLCAPALQACSEPKSAASQEGPQAPTDRVINTTADDAAMNAAIAQARATLPRFWAEFDRKRPGTSDHAVKLAITGQDGFKEHIWAYILRREGDQVVAELANVPEHLGGLRQGSEVRVSQTLISHWGYVKDDTLYGHYTTRVLWPRMSPEERAGVKLSPTPLEPNAS
jgi:uncharacterized protein YegJ (DUF2314 family)